jgi:hypothetical protein
MDRTADLLAEYLVHHAVLLDSGKAGEGLGDDGRLKVVAAAGPVIDFRYGAGNCGLDTGFDGGCVGHRQQV